MKFFAKIFLGLLLCAPFVRSAAADSVRIGVLPFAGGEAVSLSEAEAITDIFVRELAGLEDVEVLGPETFAGFPERGLGNFADSDLDAAASAGRSAGV
ncbi:MAG: hypothetical protein LBQ19_06335, partial [Synergistaceae bacterium]|nr:hypothetical protein [Synergistaceae bacterium]